MKIDDVTVTLFAWSDIPATAYGRQTGRFGGESVLGLVTVSTDEGLRGHAFLGSAMNGADNDAQAAVNHLKPLLMGRDPLDREALHRDLMARRRAVSWRGIGAMDVALWDIAGKAADLPAHRLMGTFRHSAPAYASSAVLPSPEAYAEEAARYKAEGWRAYKIHPPARWRDDIAVCEAVRAAVGDDFRVMLDSTWSYDYEEAIRVGRAIEALGFHWFEDPLADDDIYNCAKLREKLDIPLMATEYAPGGFTAYVPWVTMRATDYLRGDVAVKGGMTPVLKTAHLAEAFGMRYEVHHGGNSHNNWANLHAIAAIPNTSFFEVLLPSGAQKYGVIDDIEVDSDGLVHVPDRPGIGARIDFDLIGAKTVAVLA